jgi:RNA polymerase sigma-70 factor, ECF subfamily
MTETQLVSGCRQHDRKTQHQVYSTFGSKVLGICKRYMKDHERAEEMAMNAFLAVYQKIGQYKSEGSFEGWILRIAVNCCLMELRKKTNFTNEVPAESVAIRDDASAESLALEGDIEQMLKILPEGARVIFNLYAIEGYKHSEIAEQLGISEGTSKSQLNYAREKLKKTFFNTTPHKL